MLALSSRTRIGTVERANAIAAATLPAEAQRRLTVMPIEITTGYRRPDGQWPPRCPVAWLVHEFNARVASHVEAPDPHDRRLGPDQFVVSLRHYRPAESELSRERLKAALSTAEGLLLQPRGEGELIELSDDEAVAAAVMLPMVAADRLAPIGLKPHRRGVQAQCAGDRLSIAPVPIRRRAGTHPRRKHQHCTFIGLQCWLRRANVHSPSNRNLEED